MQHKTNTIIDTISNTVRLSDFIGQYVKLTSRGANFLGLCPFHAEKTPSFTVNNDKKLFYCFGCKESGNIIQFAIKYNNISFKEALEQVAGFAGISLDQYTYKKLSARELLLKELTELNNQVALVYHKELKKGQNPALTYLKNRQIHSSSISQFLLGSSPADYHFLASQINLNDFHTRVLQNSQLFYEQKIPNNPLQDRFRDKIIFPIQNSKGDIIAFGSRVLDNSLPKYINSPETHLFKKRETLYGLYQAKESIKAQKCVYITEGYFDVIAMHQNGYTNTVATLGTAITTQHIQILKNSTENIILLFDGDLAGEKAAQKALFICLAQEITPKIVLCEEGKDPYDMATYLNDNLVQWITKQTKTWEEFLIHTIAKETNPITQQKIVKTYLNNLETLNPFLSQSFASSMGEYFKIPINTFLSSDQTIQKHYIKNTPVKPVYKEKAISYKEKETNTELLFICLCLYIPNDFYHLQREFNLSPAFFTTESAQSLFHLFLSQNGFVLEDFFNMIPTNLKNIVDTYTPMITAIEEKPKALLDCYYSLQIGSLIQQEKELKQNISSIKEQEEIILILKDLEAINKKKKLLEEKIKNRSFI